MAMLSVIVPVYNADRYLDRCIISILQQSHPNFEVIFVDDCSSDHSASMVKHFARNDSRITLISHTKNRGPGAARNTGLAVAHGEYVTFVDSDDFISPQLFEIMATASDGGKFDVVETGCQAIDDQDNVLWDYAPEPMTINNLSQDPHSMFLLREWGVTQKLWRKSLFQGGIGFPEGIFWEDIAVVPTLISDARSLVRVDYIGYNYLQRSGSITNSHSVKHVNDLFVAFDYFIAHLRKRNIFEQYKDALSHMIKICAEYLLKRLRSNLQIEPENVESLVRLCEATTVRYLEEINGSPPTDPASIEATPNIVSSHKSKHRLGAMIAKLTGGQYGAED